MDASYFLKKRTNFIRFYYDGCISAFDRIKLQIQNEEPPFDDPPQNEDDEPAFLSEWMDAESAREVAGLSAVSLLSDSLKLYFRTLQDRVICFTISKDAERFAAKNGFVALYKEALGHIFQTDWSDCPVRFDMIEQVVLARNNSQHGTHLTSLESTHDSKTLKKYPNPFFASESEWRTWQELGGNTDAYFAPKVLVTRETLFAAIGQTETLADWIEARLDKAAEWRAGRDDDV